MRYSQHDVSENT
ncbi:hypothetical protein V1478_005529, partial [Vespula squamosa]